MCIPTKEGKKTVYQGINLKCGECASTARVATAIVFLAMINLVVIAIQVCGWAVPWQWWLLSSEGHQQISSLLQIAAAAAAAAM